MIDCEWCEVNGGDDECGVEVDSRWYIYGFRCGGVRWLRFGWWFGVCFGFWVSLREWGRIRKWVRIRVREGRRMWGRNYWGSFRWFEVRARRREIVVVELWVFV